MGITVSKLCHPVCWELLKLLQDSPNDFQVWTPQLILSHQPIVLASQNTLKKMVDHFTGHLKSELEQAFNPTTSLGHQHDRSMGSASG